MRRLLPTTALLLALAAGASAPARAYVIRGHGNGHGVGLSQWGAYGYARHGWSYDTQAHIEQFIAGHRGLFQA